MGKDHPNDKGNLTVDPRNRGTVNLPDVELRQREALKIFKVIQTAKIIN